MIAPTQPKRERELIPAKTHIVKLYSIIDLGTETSEMKSQKTWLMETVKARKIRMTFEFPKITKEFEWVTKPVVKSVKFTLSFSEKSNLYKFVKNRGFDVNVVEWFDVSQLLGKAGLWSVVHTNSSDGTVYDNLASVSPLMDGMEVEEWTFNPIVMFDLDEDFRQETFDSFPKFIQEEIMKSPEYSIAIEKMNKKQEADEVF